MRFLLMIASRRAWLRAAGQRLEARIIARHRRGQRQGVATSSYPIELMATGVRCQRCRHRDFQHIAVARVDRTCDAYTARAVRARETVGDDAPRLCEGGAVWFSRAQ